jgi:glutamate--cysteine ligase catalytic subunit
LFLHFFCALFSLHFFCLLYFLLSHSVHLDDKTEVDHWENLQSTNWQTVRFKPPPEIAVREDGAGASTAACADAASRDTASASASASVSPIGGESSGSGSSSPSGASSKAPDDGHIGWRTEFRPMEVQLTDFENAAFTVFIALVSRVILAFELNLYVPMSKVDENMERAHTRNAVLEQKFFFRNHMDGEPDRSACSCADGSAECSVHNHADSISEFTVLEILTGKGSYFPGLVPLCKFYLDEIECDAATKKACYAYFELLIERANGDIMTAAAWQRHFVTTHPAYRQDSVVSQEIAFDLVKTCHEVAMGKKHIPELLGAHTIRPIDISNAFPHKPLKGRSSSAGGSRPAHMDAVIGRYAARAQVRSLRSLRVLIRRVRASGARRMGEDAGAMGEISERTPDKNPARRCAVTDAQLTRASPSLAPLRSARR